MMTDANYRGRYVARRVGSSIVLSCPAAKDRAEYDLFDDPDTGAIIFVPAVLAQ